MIFFFTNNPNKIFREGLGLWRDGAEWGGGGRWEEG